MEFLDFQFVLSGKDILLFVAKGFASMLVLIVVGLLINLGSNCNGKRNRKD